MPLSRSLSDKRRTIHGLSSNNQFESSNRNRQPVSMMPTPRYHQRSRSAINSEIIVSSSKSANSLLHSNNHANSNKNRRSFAGLHTLKEEMTVDSLKDMINTLKTLPPITTPTGNTTKIDRQPSDENLFLSREAAFAEAEAKLTGTFNRRDDNSVKKRTSLQQLPVLNEHGEAFMMEHSNSSKRTSMNSKSLSLSLSASNSDSRKSMNRRSSRNFDEWRNSKVSCSVYKSQNRY
jgi:protein SSD1